MNHLEQTSLPESYVEQLASTELAYSFKLPGGALSATQQAHEFYGFEPLEPADTTFTYRPNRDPKTPSIHAILASPHELPREGADEHGEQTEYLRAIGGVTIWMAHAQTPAEYQADVHARSAGVIGSEADNLPAVVKESLMEDITQRIQTEGPKYQLIDMLNAAELTVLLQTAIAREQAYPMTPSRRDMLRQQGSPLSIHSTKPGGRIVYETEFITTKSVQAFALKRTVQMSDGVFGIYHREPFSIHRNSFVMGILR